ncbi:hypothetical protein BO71DRAFT_453735 [Aspergillus ellipticus CBS 707.79]|uniref:Uncharacterized protein n=1 Tax=Aspergillus ellipticus CBS 707.79 TaxID=1448320 RepID=A0A319CWI5_9EURO|nr:hypothetical protein BO71DRAFT_453735 [Aspergillus ellipticus CBS 707.79]
MDPDTPFKIATTSAVRRLLNDPAILPSVAAEDAMRPFLTSDFARPNYRDLWPLLFTAVKRITDQSDRLLEFLVALQAMPYCNGEFHRLDGLEECLRRSVFTYVDHPIDHPVDPRRRKFGRREWLNINSFVAKIHARGLYPGLRHGGWVVKRTLETAVWELSDPLDLAKCLDYQPDFRTGEVWDVDGLLDNIDITALDGGDQGWSKERWAFWKERFGWVAGVEVLEEKTRRIARDVVALMGVIDGSTARIG